MATITVILADDLITDSRAVINTNFANLNSDKIETSYLDTDTTLAANSDVKIATQKAVKAYVDAGGNVNASETTRGIVEEATDAEVTAGTETGGTGAKLFVTPAKLATRLSGGTTPTLNVYSTVSTVVGGSTTRFDITNPSGTTFRYTFDGTGTDPSFSAANYPAGTGIYFNAQNFTAANNGSFTVTGSGTNYVEVTNASGVAENDKTIGTGFVLKGSAVWTKPAGLKYVIVELVGGAGSSCQTGGNGINAAGSSGGYSWKKILTASLGAVEGVIVGFGGAAVAQNANGNPGRPSGFGSHLSATGATASTHTGASGGGGTGTGGDINFTGQKGSPYQALTGSGWNIGGSNPIGFGGIGDSITPTGYGAGPSGGTSGGTSRAGGDGVVRVTEYYS